MEAVPDVPQHLRARADALRRHAATLDHQPLALVRLRAGDDAWIGPSAVAFRDALGLAERHLCSAADGLRRHARRLDAEADAAVSTAADSALAGAGDAGLLMGYLAFDRDAVRLLGLSLQRALTELERVRITDDRVVSERGQVAAAERAVAGWSERLRDISMCAAMSERRPVLTSRGDLDRALWSQIASATRMALVVDPLDPAGGDVETDPYLRGAALAAVLRERPGPAHRRRDRPTEPSARTADGDGTRPAGFHRPSRRRRADQSLRRPRGAPGAARPPQLADPRCWCGGERAGHRRAARDDRGSGAQRRDEGGSIDLEAVTVAVSPAVAAQLIAGMSLAADELASLTRSVLARWWDTSSASDNALLVTTRAPGDVLLPLVAADPLASRSFVSSIDGRWSWSCGPRATSRRPRRSSCTGPTLPRCSRPRRG